VKSGVLDEIHQVGGEVFGVSSEPQTLATEAKEEWEIQFPVVGDPHHEIRKVCSERGWLDVFYNEDSGHLRERKWASHPNGYYQPAVVAVHRSGRVLYRWRCVPKFSNMNGAGARPEPVYTWQKIKESLLNEDEAVLDTNPEMGSKEVGWFTFMLMLTAHGWFIRPKAFPLSREGDKESANPKQMTPRIFGFAVLWLFLLVVLPLEWFGAAVVTWLTVLTPGLIEIHRQFQHESDPY
jgi:peroxiredoxin